MKTPLQPHGNGSPAPSGAAGVSGALSDSRISGPGERHGRGAAAAAAPGSPWLPPEPAQLPRADRGAAQSAAGPRGAGERERAAPGSGARAGARARSPARGPAPRLVVLPAPRGGVRRAGGSGRLRRAGGGPGGGGPGLRGARPLRRAAGLQPGRGAGGPGVRAAAARRHALPLPLCRPDRRLQEPGRRAQQLLPGAHRPPHAARAGGDGPGHRPRPEQRAGVPLRGARPPDPPGGALRSRRRAPEESLPRVLGQVSEMREEGPALGYGGEEAEGARFTEMPQEEVEGCDHCLGAPAGGRRFLIGRGLLSLADKRS